MISSNILRSVSFVLVLAAMSAAVVHADESEHMTRSEPDKSAYTLFNPTPREYMRPLSADRPDTTESPHTVDAGHFQVEMSFFDYGRDGRSGTRSISVAPTNLKIGLLNNVDLQLGIEPWTRVDTPQGDGKGFGNLVLHSKINLWGNDEGDTAFAVMPWISIPTADSSLGRTNHVEGGIIFPLGIELPYEFSLGLMAEFDFVRNDRDSGYDTEFLHTVVLGRSLIGDLAGFVEYIGISPLDGGGTYRAACSFGLTFALSEDVQLDCGTTLGITDNVDDYHIFAGITWRY